MGQKTFITRAYIKHNMYMEFNKNTICLSNLFNKLIVQLVWLALKVLVKHFDLRVFSRADICLTKTSSIDYWLCLVNQNQEDLFVKDSLLQCIPRGFTLHHIISHTPGIPIGERFTLERE